jgi:Holliday junction resolvase
MLEAQIEAAAVKAALEEGWYVAKFTSPQRRSVPDRIFIKGGRVVFIEFKRPGGKLTSGQEREIEKLRRHGAEVWVCYSKQEVAEVLKFGSKVGLYPEKP